LQKECDASQRQACRAVHQPRSTQRYCPQIKPDEPVLIQRMHELVRRHPRFGYRRIWAMLRAEGWRVNPKRVRRLWKQEGFRVPTKTHKKRRLGHSNNGILRHRSLHKNDVWTWDFIHDSDEAGRPLKWFSLVDEYTRECLALEVNRSMTAVDVIEVLAAVFRQRSLPRCIRSDNGPEFIAAAIRQYLGSAGIDTLYIEPGSPWENGYAESFHGRLRDELLNLEVFANLGEAKALADHWRQEYNYVRPHSSLGYATPTAFAARCSNDNNHEDNSMDASGALPPNPRLLPLLGNSHDNNSESDYTGQTLITVGT
jgi:transposase InsO family protein